MDVEISRSFLVRCRNWVGSENLARKERFGNQHGGAYCLDMSSYAKTKDKTKGFSEGQ